MAKIRIIFEGEQGSGKTTLMRAIARRLGPDVVTVDPRRVGSDLHALEIDPSPVFLAALRAENGQA
jgi:MoxR-like ATPase